MRDLQLRTDIGSYGPHEVVPDAHVLDLTLWLAPALVLIAQDGMAHVFDYDPLVVEIEGPRGAGVFAMRAPGGRLEPFAGRRPPRGERCRPAAGAELTCDLRLAA